MLKKTLFTIALCCQVAAQASDTIFVKQPQIPVLIERQDNVLFYMRLDAKSSESLDEVTIDLGDKASLQHIKSLKLYYSGTDALQDRNKNRFAPVDYIPSNIPGKTLFANKSYSIKKSELKPAQTSITLKGNQKLYPGLNFFWVSVEMERSAPVDTKIRAKVTSIKADGKNLPLKTISDTDMERRMGVGVRHAGDDGSAVFRIPGLVTTNKGTLLGVYDVRYNNGNDLQEHVDIGLSRSTDGGKTWEKMRLPMSFGETEGLPAAQNGVGDPSILVDTQNNTVWIVAAWTHGMGHQRAWTSSQPGMTKETTAQLVMVKSTDDGKTWSEPINVTQQVKKPEWCFLLQGPGRGITMQDGTLVFPIQYIDENRIPNAGIMYSKDHGETWQIHNHARTNTTESQVAEVMPGVLMLNMRDNRGGSRAVYTTNDLGRTWKEHESSRTALIEPICQASLIGVKAEDNILGKDLLIFSNPNTTSGRRNTTIKVSMDGGKTWLKEHQVLLDEGYNWGYSCLTMIDKETVGILYESSVAHMTFQTVKLKELVK